MTRFLNSRLFGERGITRFWVALGLCLLLSDSVVAQNAETVKTYVLGGMHQARSELGSGICEITLRSVHEDATVPQYSTDSTSRATITFSDEQEALRIDWHFPPAVASRYIEPGVDLDASLDSERTGYFIRTAEHTILWFQGKPALNIIARDSPRAGWAMFFDLKAVGFYSWVEYLHQHSWESLHEVFLRKPISAVNELGDEKYELVWQIGNPETEWIVTVDGNRGFSPVKAVFRQKLNGSTEWYVGQEFQAEWKQVSGAWVPIAWKGFCQVNPQASRDSLEMTIDWDRVNINIPPETFTWQTIDLPDDITILDSTLGPIVEIKNKYQPLARATAPPARFGLFRILMVTLGVGSLVGLLVWFVKKQPETVASKGRPSTSTRRGKRP